jgi:hypothetical protein
MSGAIPPLTPCAYMACSEITLPLILMFTDKSEFGPKAVREKK